MIRRFMHLDTPPAEVAALFHDLERWPEWVAGVRSLRVLERDRDRLQVEMVQAQMGRTFRQVLDCRLSPGGLAQRQVTGSFRRWDLSWRFQPPPDGHGTTVVMELELDLGALGMMVPTRLVQGAINQMCSRSVAAARQRLHRPAAAEHAAAIAGDEAARVLAAVRSGRQVFLEVAGRRYRLEPESQ